MKVFTYIFILLLWLPFSVAENFENQNANRTKREPPAYRFPPLYAPPRKGPHYAPPKPFYGPPNYKYGSPKPIYGPPSNKYTQPKPMYGPPRNIYGPPNHLYGSPINHYGSSKLPSFMYNAPTINTKYNIPASRYNAPPTNYNVYPPYQQPSTIFTPPSSTYSPPGPSYGPPSPTYGSPPPIYGPPPSSTYGTSSGTYGVPAQPSTGYGAPSPPTPNYGPPPSKYGTPSPSHHASAPPLSRYVPPSHHASAPPSPRYVPPSSSFRPAPPTYKIASPSYEPMTPSYIPSANYQPPSGNYEIPTQNYGSSSQSYTAPPTNYEAPFPHTPYSAPSNPGYEAAPYDSGDYTYDRPVYNSVGAGYEIPVTHKPPQLQYNSPATSYETPGALTSYGTPVSNQEPPVNYGTSQKRTNYLIGDTFSPYDDIDTFDSSSSLVANANVADGFGSESKEYEGNQGPLAYLTADKTENRTLNHNLDGPGVTDDFLLKTAFRSKQLNRRASTKLTNHLDNYRNNGGDFLQMGNNSHQDMLNVKTVTNTAAKV